MSFFLYIVQELMVGLSEATNKESAQVAGKIRTAQIMTGVSCCTYPVVNLFPMLGISAATSVVSSSATPSLTSLPSLELATQGR